MRKAKLKTFKETSPVLIVCRILIDHWRQCEDKIFRYKTFTHDKSDQYSFNNESEIYELMQLIHAVEREINKGMKYSHNELNVSPIFDHFVTFVTRVDINPEIQHSTNFVEFVSSIKSGKMLVTYQMCEDNCIVHDTYSDYLEKYGNEVEPVIYINNELTLKIFHELFDVE